VNEFQSGAWAMADFIYNTSGDKFAELVFPGLHPSYMKEKALMWFDSPTRALSFLDEERRAIVLQYIEDNFRKD
jgi:hypothetical protein